MLYTVHPSKKQAAIDLKRIKGGGAECTQQKLQRHESQARADGSYERILFMHGFKPEDELEGILTKIKS